MLKTIQLPEMIMSEVCFKMVQFEGGQVGIKIKQNWPYLMITETGQWIHTGILYCTTVVYV